MHKYTPHERTHNKRPLILANSHSPMTPSVGVTQNMDLFIAWGACLGPLKCGLATSP